MDQDNQRTIQHDLNEPLRDRDAVIVRANIMAEHPDPFEQFGLARNARPVVMPSPPEEHRDRAEQLRGAAANQRDHAARRLAEFHLHIAAADQHENTAALYDAAAAALESHTAVYEAQEATETVSGECSPPDDETAGDDEGDDGYDGPMHPVACCHGAPATVTFQIHTAP